MCFLNISLGVNNQVRHVLAPQNTAHVIGQATPPLYFNCSIELESNFDLFIWYKLERTAHGRQRAGIGSASKGGVFEISAALEDEYDVEGTNLIVTDANTDDAGTYLCGNAFNKTEKYAEAIIFGKFVIVGFI